MNNGYVTISITFVLLFWILVICLLLDCAHTAELRPLIKRLIGQLINLIH